MFYERMLEESKNLASQIKEICEKLKKFPNGTIFCTQNGKYFKWYLSKKRSQTYIPKKNRALAEQYAVKKYLSLLLEDLLSEKKSVDSYLKNHSKHRRQSVELLQNPAYQELLAPYFISQTKELHNWAIAPYEKNPKYPEQLIYKTSSGIYVRSKSEVMIEMYLYMNKIPYRYEAALSLGELTFFPDFTIRHPKTGKIYYWEHFGMVDDPSYRQKMLSKLQIYSSNKIFPTIQLITTYETKDAPLRPDLVDNLIRYYFL